MSRRLPFRPDVAAILDGTLPRVEALWQVGRAQLGHAINVLAVHRGDPRPYSNVEGGGSTDVDGVGYWWGPFGFRYERTDWVDGVFSKTILWSAKWPEIADVLRPHLSGPLLEEARAAAAARRAWWEAEPPSWERKAPASMIDAERAAREERELERRAIEDRCYEIADDLWLAARPAVQEALF